MSANEDAARDEIARRLEAVGYKVEIVPEGEAETADLCARCPTDTLLVEVKNRTDDEALREKLAAADDREPVWDAQSINWNAPSDRLLHKVRSQLQDTPEDYQGIGGMWLIPAPHLSVSAAAEQLRATLLGIRNVFFNDAEGNHLSGWCVFATHAAFLKFPEVTFVVMDVEGGSQLIINPFSPRADEMRATRLYEFFGEGVLDVDRVDSGPDLFVVRGDFPRNEEARTLAVLREQHPELEFQAFFDLQMHRGNIRIPFPEK